MSSHRAKWAVGLLLCGCTAASPVVSSPNGLPGDTPSVAPSSVAASPPPLLDPNDAIFAMEMTPSTPCIGQPITLKGMRFAGAGRATVWIKGDTPEQALIAGRYALDHVPYAVKVADVPIGADGNFTATVTLSSRMAPVSTGGWIDLRPGQDLTFVVIDDGRGGGTRGVGFRLGDEEACGETGVPKPPDVALDLDPAFPCFGEDVTVTGSGFSADTATLEFKNEITRFGDGPTATAAMPVQDGSFRFTFRLDDIKQAGGEPLFHEEGGRYLIRAFDTLSNRYASTPLPICNPALERALTAPSIPLAAGITGQIEAPAPSRVTTVLRSQAAWEQFAQDQQLPAGAWELMREVDFAREQLLAIAEPMDGRAAWLEVVAVEVAKDQHRVHSVIWDMPSPLQEHGRLLFLQPMPRSDRPVEFLEPAHGYSTQREALAPALRERSLRRLLVFPEGAFTLEPFLPTP